MQVLIRPVVGLMGRLRLIPKFFIVAILFAAPALMVSSLLINELNKAILITGQERLGVMHLKLLQDLSRLVQQHRALRHLALAGNHPASAAARKKQEEVSATLAQLDALQRRHPEMKLASAVDLNKKSWTALVEAMPGATAKASYQAHSALIAQLSKLGASLADHSHLSLDPQVDTYYLIHIFSKALPELASVVSDIAARGAPYIDTGLLEPNEDVLINANIMWAKRDLERLPAQLEALFRESPGAQEKLGSPQAVMASNLKFLERARNEVSNALDQTNGTEFLANGSESVEALYAYSSAAATLLDATLAERNELHVLHRNWIIFSIFACLIIALYLLAGFYLSFSREIRKLSLAVDAIAAGNLSTRIEPDGRDEVALLLRAFDGMRLVLARMVAEIRQSTDSISTASSEIAHGNADLSTRTEHQAASLEQTSASMEELTSAVKQNTRSAQQANQNALSAAEIAREGGMAVAKMIAMMEAIQGSSKKIGEIISVIDGIAFQTNILALNAAVEAARAGEQGRGFAVVASEVRNLAQRSAGAAREINTLITASMEQVGAGSRQVHSAGQTMQEIVFSIDAVTANMCEISAASKAQQAGIERVHQTLNALDGITQQNAALVEQAAAAAQSMHDQSGLLTRAVAVFTLEDAPLEPATPMANNANKIRHIAQSKLPVKAWRENAEAAPLHSMRRTQTR